MQVPEHAGGALALEALRYYRRGKWMQFDAVMHAELKMAKNKEETHKKPASACPFQGGASGINAHAKHQ